MAVYRDLFFNNLSSLLGSTFPVLKKLHDAERWQQFVREFMVRHRAKTPYFMEVPREFLTFLESTYRPRDDDYPFLAELAHYEWAELALAVAPETIDRAVVDVDGDLLAGVPLRSPLAWSFCYRFPVHRISPSFRPDSPGEQPTYLVIYRREDDELGFMELNAVTARLLELVGANDRRASGRELILQLAQEIGYEDQEALLQHGRQALDDMREAGILLGTSRLP